MYSSLKWLIKYFRSHYNTIQNCDSYFNRFSTILVKNFMMVVIFGSWTMDVFQKGPPHRFLISHFSWLKLSFLIFTRNEQCRPVWRCKSLKIFLLSDFSSPTPWTWPINKTLKLINVAKNFIKLATEISMLSLSWNKIDSRKWTDRKLLREMRK